MEDIINNPLSDKEIADYNKKHEEAKKSGNDEVVARFQYAYALIRSKHSQDIVYGVKILEELFYNGDRNARRDYMYYIAIGQTRLKNYDMALDCVEQFLQSEPENRQAQKLRGFIKEKLTKDGLVGMAITGGAALVIGGLIGLGMSMAKK